jgi:cytochrome c oxidase cbb3-type subunit I/II
LLAINYLMTWRTRPSAYDVPLIQAMPLSRDYVDPPPPPSRIEAGVLEVAKKLDVWQQLQWHRVWERKSFQFTVWVVIAVVLASALEMIPTFLIRSNVPTIATVKPYTPLELAGRDIYLAEGCYNCHSQMIRPLFAETERYGEYSKPGEFIYDRPFQWGSRRIGPDLAREGGKNSHKWHFDHFRDPGAVVARSIMPAYEHLYTTRLNFGLIQDRINAVRWLGAPYERELSEAEVMAREQAAKIVKELVEQGGPAFYQDARGNPIDLRETKLIALIAYIQRIGTDLYAQPITDQPASPADGQPPTEGAPSVEPPAVGGAVTLPVDSSTDAEHERRTSPSFVASERSGR